jgi:hypothetical protein
MFLAALCPQKSLEQNARARTKLLQQLERQRHPRMELFKQDSVSEEQLQRAYPRRTIDGCRGKILV